VTDGNGWRAGKDPVQRVLRIVTSVVCLGVFAFLTVDPGRNIDDLPTIALVIGSLLVLLGYESIIRLPGIGRGPSRRDDDDPAV